MISGDKAVFVSIDYQEKLVPAMYEHEELIADSVKFIRGLKAIGVPGLATTQYAKGLGDTVPEIKEALGDTEVIDKNTFSVCGSDAFRSAFAEIAEGKDVIAIGIETHICLEQSVLDMIDMGCTVYVPADCVSSRRKKDKDTALRRLEKAGCIVTSYEALLFEMIRGAKHPAFKEISAIVK